MWEKSETGIKHDLITDPRQGRFSDSAQSEWREKKGKQDVLIVLMKSEIVRENRSLSLKSRLEHVGFMTYLQSRSMKP